MQKALLLVILIGYIPVGAAAEVLDVPLNEITMEEVTLNEDARECLDNVAALKALPKVEKEAPLAELSVEVQNLVLRFDTANIDKSRQFFAERCLNAVVQQVAAFAADDLNSSESKSTGEPHDLNGLTLGEYFGAN